MLNWVEVDAAAISSNVGQFLRRLGDSVRLGAVVKSNAYGHGMVPVAEIALRAGASWLCVNHVDEALELREAGVDGPILVMGYVPLERLKEVVRHDLRAVVYNRETLARLDELAAPAGRSVAVHLKVETGTHRQGIPETEVAGFAEKIRSSGHLSLDGVTTHFANIEDTTDHSFAEEQMAAFARIVETLPRSEFGEYVRHTACSAAALLFTRTHLDMARIGISLYGLWPSKETYVSCRQEHKPLLDLSPALTWKTRIAQVKSVPENSFVGYGCTYRTTRASRIAVLPFGYYEGYDRKLSDLSHVLIRGRRAPVRGRICMNMCMVDVTDIDGASLEDEVVLLGGQGEERISAEQIASWSGTIAYDVVSRIHPSLPRVVIEKPASTGSGSD
ncbi:MAG: alanine racemase [bacterium]|nr:alanine racemase [bacterium]